MKAKLRDLMTKIFSTPLGFAIFVFVGGFIAGMARLIARQQLQLRNVLWGSIGALFAAIFVYVSYKKIIDRIG